MLDASDSPLSRLQHHAEVRGSEVALLEQQGASWLSLTWSELHRRVLDGAAGMMQSGVGVGQVVVILVPAGVRLVELELATRAAGAVPLMLPEGLEPRKVGTLLAGMDVRLVVADRQQRLAQLRHVRLAEAELFECDDESWGRLRAFGAQHRTRTPGLVARAEASRAPALTRTVLALPRDKNDPWLFWPDATGTTGELVADDVVLVVGAPSDRFTTVVRDAHQRAGCTLAWVEAPERLGAGLQHVRPTHVLLDQACARVLDDVLVNACLDDLPWHAAPQDVLDAASAVAAGARVGSKGRRLAAELTRLAPWWGDRMRVLVVDGRVGRTVTGLAAGLGFEVGRMSHVPASRLDLAVRRPPARPQPAPRSVAQPQPDPADSLPRRARSGLDAAFSL
ncbi:MAG: hypothetical protein AVDCRST_MAG32-576 [uncultured Nocardioides sp.]|uniref:AMP-dependent synthetase/ligase domain-containing protein n=1 Tax=uncultured Nocardioides sp. TaxID=198441 RepID=A0A6J4MZU1_9ACTN|nr:MAG: hypothetical protein AVDCRST_MAG32-576 [uncultured Nocardioides sp.]